MEFTNSEALSLLFFIRNRSCNVINFEDKIYHHLLGGTIDALLNFPKNSENFGNEDLKSFYYSKLKEFHTVSDFKEILHLLNCFRYGKPNPFDCFLTSYGMKFVNQLSQNDIDNELFSTLKLLTFFHFAFSFIYSEYRESSKEINFILSMIIPFKTLMPRIKILKLQSWNISDCDKRKCPYYLTFMQRILNFRKLNRRSSFIQTR